jgi:carbamoyl-phosphate synthase large subunit
MIDEKPTILVSAVSGDIGYSVVQALRTKASRIIGCDLNPDTPVRQLLDNFYKVPPAVDSINYLFAIKDILKQEGLEFFLPISEPEIALIHNSRKEFTSLPVKLLLNNPLILNTFLDKVETVNFLSNIGIRVPKTTSLNEYDGSFGFPVIVKARAGYGSKKLWKAEDLFDLEYIKRKNDAHYIVQEYIGTPDEEYTTGVFSDGKKISSISFRRKLGMDGTTLEATLVQEGRLHDLSCKIAEATSLIGSINVQYRRLGNMFIPFEVNPRISGTILFRKQFGFEDVSWWINILSGMEYTYQPLYQSGRAIRYYSECYFDMERV